MAYLRVRNKRRIVTEPESEGSMVLKASVRRKQVGMVRARDRKRCPVCSTKDRLLKKGEGEDNDAVLC